MVITIQVNYFTGYLRLLITTLLFPNNRLVFTYTSRFIIAIVVVCCNCSTEEKLQTPSKNATVGSDVDLVCFDHAPNVTSITWFFNEAKYPAVDG